MKRNSAVRGSVSIMEACFLCSSLIIWEELFSPAMVELATSLCSWMLLARKVIVATMVVYT